MISKKLIIKAQKIAYKYSNDYSLPSNVQIDLAAKKSVELADILNANKDITLIGMYLADCTIGKAFYENKLKDHIAMSLEEAQKLFSKKSKLTANEKENILSCIRQHHGASKFYSIEAEIVCNADCYKFCSLIGFIDNIRSMHKMEMYSCLNFLKNKVHEKWNLLSIDYCKKELNTQYELLNKILSMY